MTDKEVLLDLLQNFMEVLRGTISDLPLEALRWQPGPEANNIAVTVWHVSRAFDLLKVRALENQDSAAEQWFTAGWAVRTGYDPRGLGYGGFGNLAGYTQAEVAAVPILPAEELLAYFEEVANALYNYLQQMPAEALHQPPAGWAKPPYLSAYGWIRNFLLDSREHLGEIKAIKAMWERKVKRREGGDE